ncbi:NAD-dependent epimerase/dehydratase family protein [Egicoccus halophilus]|uniref:UDP-glucose 4-epimerase n=1 Tax=Egicoccus halophilus TaxID=1670830 RepID=A0A8J3A804_9ACTN|nr:NAD-dependent epimerase/dehydratase family protein [Egicoccus halophilus]GGI03940.1 UDP-glucose 4-epimerase [Egicoccus halophilus]
MSDRPVVVTGAAGFIGSNLVLRLLEDGHRVIGVDDLSTGALGNLAVARERHAGRFEFDRLDIRQGGLPRLFERLDPEVVFHLAAQVDVRRSVEDPVHDASINVLGTLAVLEASRAVDVRKIVYASSIGSYGEPSEHELPVDESFDRPALSPYGVSKRVAMDYLRSYELLHGIDWTALTLANVYGPHQTTAGEGGVVATFAGRMLAGQPCTVFGDGEQTRDFVYVDDVVHALVLAADRAPGRRLLIGTGERTSVLQLFRALAAATGYPHEPVHAPARDGEVHHSCVDARAAARELGWKPWTTLEEGLAATLAWAAGTSRA